jgi:hypothetical protein
MGGQVVGQAPCPDGASREEQIANARLIAAAPKLLAACEASHTAKTQDELDRAVALIAEAIAESRGAA